MSNIRDIEGVADAQATKLEGQGIKTLSQLLVAAGSKAGRQDLASKSGISEKLILEWVNRADLDRVRGVGSEYADLLEASGVDSVVELANRNATNLYNRMAEVNKAKNYVRNLPAESMVASWIEHAKTLDQAVTH
jgi:predicted flap endonuclease-1-like 5' DNA nuclease